MKELRKTLPGIQKITYFNYARTGPLMQPAAEQIKLLFEEALEPFEFHKDAWISYREAARKTIAELIGASVNEIAFTTSTSSGLSLIAASIPWQKADRILYLSDEYPSNRFVWDNLEEKGVITEAIEPIKGVLFSQQLQEMDLSQVRLVAVSAVSFWGGRKHDIEQLANICHQNGILLSVDAIQAVGAIPVDVKKWNCDFLASGGQKWLFGPIGTGFVYFNKAIIPDLFVPQIGWGSIKPLSDLLSPDFEFADGAKRFEAGHSDIPALVGLATSIETMKKIGWKKIHSRIAALVDKAQKELLQLGCPPLVTGPQSGIIAFEPPNAEIIYQKLTEQKIYTTLRALRIRISLHASVSDEELDLFFDILRALIP